MEPVNSLEDRIDSPLDEGITAAVSDGASTPTEITSLIPSVNPAAVAPALGRHILAKTISTQGGLLGSAASSQAHVPQDNTHENALPVPHPLDYEWRFSAKTIEDLLETCQRATRKNDLVVLLGAPSLLRAGIERPYARRLLLLDANPALTASFANSAKFVQSNLLTDPIPELSAGAVVVDPPWYEEHINAFLWVASRICRIRGTILLSLPPVGTRPGIEQERAKLLEWTRELSLELKNISAAALSYLSPPFEHNSMSAEGITGTPDEWRRGDLFVFTIERRHKVPRPAGVTVERLWDEVTIKRIRIRVLRSQERSFSNPSLVSVIPRDVLPSVSRRDGRRSLAEVWTSGNRIFGCEGKSILSHILKAIAADLPPASLVAAFLQRDLTPSEQALVSKTSLQIINLVETEFKEYVFRDESSPEFVNF